MLLRAAALTLTLGAGLAPRADAQTNPLWHEEKIKNFLPHMTWPEVRDLLTRSDVEEEGAWPPEIQNRYFTPS